MRMVYDVSATAVRVAWSFLGPPPKLSRQLPCCLRSRDSDGFDNTSSIFETGDVRDVDLDKAHQVPVPQVVQGLQATESNRNEHVEQESQIPSLVKN